MVTAHTLGNMEEALRQMAVGVASELLTAENITSSRSRCSVAQALCRKAAQRHAKGTVRHIIGMGLMVNRESAEVAIRSFWVYLRLLLGDVLGAYRLQNTEIKWLQKYREAFFISLEKLGYTLP